MDAVMQLVAELRARGWVVGSHGIYAPDDGPITFNLAGGETAFLRVLDEVGFRWEFLVVGEARPGIFPPGG